MAGRAVHLREDGARAAVQVHHRVIRAKSGLPIRSGIARLATWSWMFKAFTQRDWAIFTQTFGQPVRVGKYPAGATEEDKDTLFRAVANIAGDCAAIIPESR
jgi:phage gp29-like protein